MNDESNIQDITYGEDKQVTIQKVEVVRETILVHQVVWSSKDMADLLAKLESQEGFKGFVKVKFEAGEFPEITYYREYKTQTV